MSYAVVDENLPRVSLLYGFDAAAWIIFGHSETISEKSGFGVRTVTFRRGCGKDVLTAANGVGR